MRSRYKFHEPDDTHFVTSTLAEWVPVFTTSETAMILIDSLAYARENMGLQIYAYVIMDNHFHLVARAPDLSKSIQSIKRHTERQIIEFAKATNRHWLRQQFEFHKKSFKEHTRDQVWQEGVHPQQISSDDMLNQKIDSIHNNPVRRGWVDSPEHWRYSSARNYYLDDHSVLEIDSLHEAAKQS